MTKTKLKTIIAVFLSAVFMTGCGAQNSQPKTQKTDTSLQLKASYTNKELLALTGYRKGAVTLPKSVKTPSVSSDPTALSIQLKAIHLVMNKGIKVTKNSLTETVAKKAGYSSLAALKAEAKNILIKQNKELKPTLTGSLACADAYSKAKITVTEADRKAYKKLADTSLYKTESKKNTKYGDGQNEENVKKMLFVGAIIAKEKTKLSKKDTSKTAGSDYSSYYDFYKGEAAKIASEKAIAAYTKDILK